MGLKEGKLMKKNCFCNFVLSGISLNEYGMEIPSPFCALELANSEVDSYTNWTLKITLGGSSSRKMNISAFEALIYSAAQTEGYANASGVPVSFAFGWLDDRGDVESYLSYQGWTLSYKASVNGQFMSYVLTGYASQALKASMPVLHIPALTGIVQPSAVVEALAKGIKADSYYMLDIDHSDAPTLVNHNAMTTSFLSYVRGDKTVQNDEDNYDAFPGLLRLSKSYNATRDAAGLKKGSGKLSTVMNNVSDESRSNYLKCSLTDKTPQTSTFAFWIDEPTMTQPGAIHYKDTSSLPVTADSSALKYGTSDTNIIALSGSYDGVAYNMSDLNFSTLGFTLDESGNTVVNDTTVVNSWPNSLASVYQTANIINDINALATQFSGNFQVTIAGSTDTYQLAQPVSLVVMAGNTLSPVSGIYNIMSVSHVVSSTYYTVLTLQRLAVSSANQVASGMGIFVSGSSNGKSSGYTQTNNVKSTSKVDFGQLYPTWEDIQTR